MGCRGLLYEGSSQEFVGHYFRLRPKSLFTLRLRVMMLFLKCPVGDRAGSLGIEEKVS